MRATSIVINTQERICGQKTIKKKYASQKHQNSFKHNHPVSALLSSDYKDEICEFESFLIELDNTIVGVVYNQPRKDSPNFLEYLDFSITKVSKELKTVFVTGDFIIDLPRTDTITIPEYFINLMFSNFYQPLILQPTRCTGRKDPL